VGRAGRKLQLDTFLALKNNNQGRLTSVPHGGQRVILEGREQGNTIGLRGGTIKEKKDPGAYIKKGRMKSREIPNPKKIGRTASLLEPIFIPTPLK